MPDIYTWCIRVFRVLAEDLEGLVQCYLHLLRAVIENVVQELTRLEPLIVRAAVYYLALRHLWWIITSA